MSAHRVDATHDPGPDGRQAGRTRPGVALTLGIPTSWAIALAQAPATPLRGLLLVAGWAGFACVLDHCRCASSDT